MRQRSGTGRKSSCCVKCSCPNPLPAAPVGERAGPAWKSGSAGAVAGLESKPSGATVNGPAGGSPASAVGVPDFIDEWISSPYPSQAGDRRTILDGLKWIDEESQRRFQKSFADLTPGQQTVICDDIASLKPKPALKKAAAFFKRFRDLTAGGYYTTPEGAKAIGYTGNLPSGTFEGPPPEALKHVGLMEA